MKLRYDPLLGLGYVEIGLGPSVRTEELIRDDVLLDYAADGSLIGIELLNLWWDDAEEYLQARREAEAQSE